MKNLLKQTGLMICFLLSSGSVIAQEQQKEQMPPAERASKLTAWMKKNLQLTEDQEKQAHEINLSYANKTEELRNSNETKAQKFKKIKEYNDAKDGELKKVFSEEQFKIYQEKKEEVKEEFKAKAKEKRKSDQ